MYIHLQPLHPLGHEPGESLTAALKREFLEETGIEVKVIKNVGMADFMLPWTWNNYEFVHHIAAFYLVEKVGGNLKNPQQFEGQDSLNAMWVSKDEASMNDASPLILKAFRWMEEEVLSPDVEVYEEWEIKD
ncbi:NUDIX domain-containing protein [Peribacillus frigoritolerans]|uniref:NUDIX domain-containing protein n=1 Tax=Peribacillus frigoritolerans TaxID=450367 RepID=UPI00105999E3|nr:NUDIX domain-containing protein [Peribacillus frigoritolerans]TDL82459.1 NUDIX domain-containing protein [Peribacillus frigoritolerans]